MLVHVLVLNYNGRRLLAECLPSVVDAARASRHPTTVAVIDNDSRDDSVAWLGEHFPQVELIRRPNRALVSFNDVVAGLPGEVALLLNNDVKLDQGAIDPLVEPLGDRCFMTAPRCVRFDGVTYEGLKAAVRWRFGLVEATVFYPGHQQVIELPDLTAAAGSVLAIDRRIFASLGGFDPLYLPGRLEDLDFAYRGYMAGYHARYVPDALAYHLGMGTFAAVYGEDGCAWLALRNTLLFQWKNLRHPLHRARGIGGLAVRLMFDLVRAPWTPPARRWALVRALLAAMVRWRQMRVQEGDSPILGTMLRMVAGKSGQSPSYSIRRERDFFQRFCPRRLGRTGKGTVPELFRLAAAGTAAKAATNQRASLVEVSR